MALILVDRDGVLNEDRPDSVKSPEELILYPDALQAVARLKQAGHVVALITNQSILGKETISWDQFDKIQGKLLGALSAAGGSLDRIYVAPDAPWAATERRKPGAGMLKEALAENNCAAETAPMVGDALRDLQAAHKIGCPRVLVRTGKGRKTEQDPELKKLAPVAVYDCFADFVAAYLADSDLAITKPPTLITADELP